MKTISFSLIFSLVFITACTNDSSVTEQIVNGSKVTICSYEKVLKNETIALSSLVENCRLIRLEDIDEALFKLWSTTVTDKYIGVIPAAEGPYKLFDSSGKFLCDVGSIGQGPGEYALSIYDDLIDDKNERIYLTTFLDDKIYVYDTSGKFIKNIVAPQYLHKPKMHLSEDGKLTVVHMAFPGENAVSIQFDSEGNVINQLAPIPHFFVQDHNGEIFNSRNTPAFEFLHTSSDTLYHYSIERNKIEPVFTLAVNSTEKPFRQYIELNNMYITTIWSKKQTIVTDMKTKRSSFVKVRNDYFGNMDVALNVSTLRNGWFVLNLEPWQLIEMIEKRLQESDCTAQDKQKLKALQDSLDENSNNVLFVGILKP